MPSSSPLVSAAQVARLAGVTRATVSNWRRRHPDFPAPVGGGDTRPVYALDQVRAWLASRGQLPPDSPADVLAEALRARSATTPLWPLLLAAARLEEGTLKALTELSDRRLLARLPKLVSSHAREVPSGESAAYQAGDVPAVRALLRCVLAREAPQAIDVLTADGDQGGSGTYPTPEPVAALMADLLTGGDGGYPAAVCDPACGGGGLLVAAAERGAQVLSGQDVLPGQADRAAVRLGLLPAAAAPKTIVVRAGDSLRTDELDGAEAVLCNPPYGARDWGHDELAYDPRWAYGLPPKGEPELAWVQHCLAHLAESGAAVLLMPPAVSERPAGRRIRAALVRAGALRAVVALPAGVAVPWHIGLHLWLLRRPRDQDPTPPDVLFLDTADQSTDWDALHRTVRDTWRAYTAHDGAFTPVPGTARAVATIDLLDDTVDLTPTRRVHGTPADHPKRHADTAKALRERLRRATDGFVRLIDGAALPPAGAEPAAWRTATVADLLRGGALTLLRETTAGELDIAAGDLILAEMRRHRGPAATVADEHTAGQPLERGQCLLRPDPARFDPWFLAGFLSAEDNLSAASTGTSTVRIDPRRLRVPLLPLAEQRRYGKAFRRLHALRTAADLAARLAHETTSTITAGLTSGALLPAPDHASPPPKGTH